MKKQRIDTSGAQSAMQSPFANLEIPDLPDGPSIPPAGEPVLVPLKKGRVVLRREKAQRGGKTVIVVHDFESQIENLEIETLAREARQACGCGGTVRGREIELQGDIAPRVRIFFERAGFRVCGV